MSCLVHTDALEQTARSVALAHAMGFAEKMRPPLSRPPRYPMMIEQSLGDRYAGFVDRAKPFYADLIREMPRLLASEQSRLDAGRADAGEVEKARRLLDAAKARWSTWVSDEEIQRLATYFGGQISIAQRKELGKQILAELGVDLPTTDVVTRELIADFAHANAELVGSIPEAMQSDLAALTMRAFSKRMKPETFGAEIAKRFDIGDSRARFIARDQIGKLNGQINQSRQQALGIEFYFWITMQDDAVRDSHEKRFKKRFRWDTPPATDKYDGHPGIPPGCRCNAAADLSSIVNQVKKIRML